MKDYLNAISLLPDRYKSVLESISENIGVKVKEIRFRNGEPITLNTQNDIYYIRKNGVLTVAFSSDLIVTDEKDLQEIVFHLSRRSLHTYQDMIAKGFIPLRGGCKAGVVGRAVMKNGSVYSVSSFNSIAYLFSLKLTLQLGLLLEIFLLLMEKHVDIL